MAHDYEAAKYLRQLAARLLDDPTDHYKEAYEALIAYADETAGAPPSVDAVAAPSEVWIVSEYPRGGIRGVYPSQASAEAAIAAIRRDHPDLQRSDFTVQVERIREVVEQPQSMDARFTDSAVGKAIGSAEKEPA